MVGPLQPDFDRIPTYSTHAEPGDVPLLNHFRWAAQFVREARKNPTALAS
jgi:hypothetical protein